jgi:hypothetical protein
MIAGIGDELVANCNPGLGVDQSRMLAGIELTLVRDPTGHLHAMARDCIANHSPSFDHLCLVWAPLTAIASALRCPTSTTSRLPRVTLV